MKATRVWLPALIIFLLLGNSFLFFADTSGKRVILVSIDGLAAYHLENPDLLLPSIRGLIEQGVWAESSETVFPSNTHPSHTTLITGVWPLRHGVLNNRMTNRETGESFHITNKPRSESIRVPTIFDAAHQRGMKTAAFFWPETKEDPAIDFNVVEAFDEDGLADIDATDPRLLDEFESAGIPIRWYFKWYGEEHLRPAGDQILTRAAAYTIRTHQPELVAIHLLATDVMQHKYGPTHYLAKNAITVADRCLGILRQAVEEAGLLDETTFIVTADHGFYSVDAEFNLYGYFKEAGLLDRVNIRTGGWIASVEVSSDLDAGLRKRLDSVFQSLLETEVIARILTPDDMHGMGLPRYEEDPHVAGQYMIVPEIDTTLIFDSSRPSGRRLPKEKPYHSHGYLPTHPDMYPALVLSGKGIQKGKRIGHVRHVDITATISELLNLEMNGLAGRTLTETLEGKTE